MYDPVLVSFENILINNNESLKMTVFIPRLKGRVNAKEVFIRNGSLGESHDTPAFLLDKIIESLVLAKNQLLDKI